MQPADMIERTSQFGLRIARLTGALPPGDVARTLGRQLLRCGTSVGANYRAAGRGKSRADFVNKLKIAEEECDESLYWMQLLVGAGLVPERRLEALRQEAEELLAILVASIRTARTRAGSALSGPNRQS